VRGGVRDVKGAGRDVEGMNSFWTGGRSKSEIGVKTDDPNKKKRGEQKKSNFTQPEEIPAPSG